VTADYEAIRVHQHAIQQVIPLLEAIRSVAEIAFRRAEARLTPLACYASRIDAQLGELSRLPDGPISRTEDVHGGSVVTVISSERGLCGAFNQRLVRRVRTELGRRRSQGEDIALVCLGRQGQRLLEAAKEPIVHWSALPSFALPSYLDVEAAAIDILDLMEERSCGRLIVMHHTPLRRFQYQIAIRQLFPVETPAASTVRPATPVEVKPVEDLDNLFTHLVTERVLIDLYKAVIESAISEELARVAAMRLATDNARHLLSELTLDANRARQLAETNALLEIISGFQAASSGSDGNAS
jgi:F-type H+-transporting ATPase subunit gamma